MTKPGATSNPLSFITIMTPVVAFMGGLIGGYKFLKEEIAEDATNTVSIQTLHGDLTALKSQQWQDAERLSARIEKLYDLREQLQQQMFDLEKRLLTAELKESAR